jgi:uncharacterized protein
MKLYICIECINMILETQIEEVVESQSKVILKKKIGVLREKLTSLKVVDNFALIVTGIRRCGKSTLLLQMLKKDIKKVFFLNFEDIRLTGFENDDYTRLSRVIDKTKASTIFFDEIQMMPNWELFVRQKLDEGFRVIVTGSNATLLSKELGTKLTGRHLSTELFPFSYKEFLEFKKIKNTVQAVEKYLKLGGFPEYLKTENDEILQQLLSDILNRDIAVRFGIRDVASLKKLTVYLISNIGKQVSANKLKQLLNIKSTTTVLEYFHFLENAYVVQFLPKFSYSLKTQIRNAKKIYAIDLGFFTHNSIVFTEEKGRRLENIVYLHLRRKYSELYFFQEKKECDFVVIQNGRAMELIQVCYELLPENLDRETDGLIEAMEFFKVKNGKIITLKQTEVFNKNNFTIEVMAVQNFLLT